MVLACKQFDSPLSFLGKLVNKQGIVCNIYLQSVSFCRYLGGHPSNDKPIVYKILTQGGRNNYTGVAKKGEVYTTIQKHLQHGKNYVPGYKVQTERMNTIQEAQNKADRIIKISKPKYNK